MGRHGYFTDQKFEENTGSLFSPGGEGGIVNFRGNKPHQLFLVNFWV